MIDRIMEKISRETGAPDAGEAMKIVRGAIETAITDRGHELGTRAAEIRRVIGELPTGMRSARMYLEGKAEALEETRRKLEADVIPF